MSSAPRSSLVDQLKALGINEKTAKYALSKHGNDVQRAADYVFSGNAGKDEVSDKTLKRIPTLNTVQEGESVEQESPMMSSGSSFAKWGKKKLGIKKQSKRRGSVEQVPEQTDNEDERGMQRTESLTQFSTISNDSPTTPPSPNVPLSPISRINSYDDQASNLILGAISRGRKGRTGSDGTGGALAAIGLKGAGITSPIAASRPEQVHKSKPVGGSSSKVRAPSPFFRARKSREKQRARDTSPEVGALEKDAASESDGESIATRSFRPSNSAWTDDDDETEPEHDSEEDMDELDSDELELMDEDGGVKFDDETVHNTEANAFFHQGGEAEPEEEGPLDSYGEDVEQDVLGEGPNVVVPPEPLFPTSYMSPVKKRQTLDSGLELTTSRPSYARDRCTINLTHGDPDASLEESNKRLNRYVVLSDLSEESKYAVEWAIGTVARDGDEVFLISVKEDESKVDPKTWSDSDKGQKVKNQRERQQMALLLTKQVTSLLQRTKLNITVTCQFLHAKNSRHMLLDLIDFLEPTMVIVGSRGLGKLKGILLGSTSHYLVQKSSVPVMVARRRLQRPLRKTDPAHLRHSPRVKLSSASIEKAASSKQEDEIVDVAEAEEGGDASRSEVKA